MLRSKCGQSQVCWQPIARLKYIFICEIRNCSLGIMMAFNMNTCPFIIHIFLAICMPLCVLRRKASLHTKLTWCQRSSIYYLVVGTVKAAAFAVDCLNLLMWIFVPLLASKAISLPRKRPYIHISILEWLHYHTTIYIHFPSQYVYIYVDMSNKIHISTFARTRFSNGFIWCELIHSI